MKLRCVKRLIKKPCGRILRDDIVLVENTAKRKSYPERMRRVTAIVEIDGVDTEMTFFTNNFEWAASSICDLYKARWNIETFFKQIKQTLHLGAFLGHSRNAIQWQVWTALLMYVLLRFLHTSSDWGHSFTRLYTCLRAVLWQRRGLLDYLRSYGTAGGGFRLQWAPQQAFLPGFG
jgi:IS4 transposase